jgi:hypothetical protein
MHITNQEKDLQNKIQQWQALFKETQALSQIKDISDADIAAEIKASEEEITHCRVSLALKINTKIYTKISRKITELLNFPVSKSQSPLPIFNH